MDKKKKVWSDDVPWAVRDAHAQVMKEKGNRDKQGIRGTPPMKYYIPIVPVFNVLKKFLKRLLRKT
jgi:hypothetical protein